MKIGIGMYGINGHQIGYIFEGHQEEVELVATWYYRRGDSGICVKVLFLS